MFADIKFTENNIQFAFVKNIRSLEYLEKECVLKGNEEEIYTKIRSLQRKKEFLSARILLQNEFNKDYQIAYKESGQPFIKNKKELSISISHSKQWLVIAISTQKIGIDIEEISDRIFRIKEKFCSIEELQNIDTKQETKHLILLWSAKESAYKLLQDKNIIFNEDLVTNKFIPEKDGTFKIPFSKRKINIPIHYRFIEESVFTYCYQ